MPKIMCFIVLLVFLISGCGSSDLSGRQYYEQGIDFLAGGNPNGAIIAFKKAIEKDNNYHEARYQLARAYILRGKYDSAERELRRVLQAKPSFSEAHLALAKSLLNMGRTGDALQEIELYFENEKDKNPEAYEVAAGAYVAKKDFGRAEEYLKKAVKMSPERISSKIMLADIYLDTGRTARSETLVNEVLESDDKNKKALYLLANIRKKQDKTRDLINIYQKILDLFPGEIAAQFQLAMTYIGEEELEKAGKIAQNLEESYKERAEGPYLNGLVYYRQGKIDDAIASFQASVRRAAIPGAYYYLGLCRMLKGDLEKATGDFQRVIDMRPEMIQPRLLLAVTHLRKGRAEDAEKATQAVLEMDEKNAFAHNLLGSAYLALGKGDLAMKEFDRAIELNPSLVDAHIKKGLFNLSSGNSKKAEEDFTTAVRIAPDLLNTRIILARYYIRNKNFTKAVRTLKEGLKDNPDDAVLYNIIGMAYLGAGETDRGVEYFKKAIAYKQDFFRPYFNLARVYMAGGEKEKAIAEYRRVLGIDDKNVMAMIMLAGIMEADKKEKEALAYYTRAKEQKKPVAYLYLAGYYQRKKDSEKAIQTLQEGLSLYPKDAGILDMQGRIYAANRDYKKALYVFGNLKAVSPEAGMERLAGVYAAMGEYDRAIRELEGILAKNAGRTDLRRRIADLCILKKDYAEAERNAKEFISLEPGNDAGYQTLAMAYAADGRFRDAVAALKKAEKMNPDNIRTKVMMGRVYMSGGNFRKAMELFKNIQKTNPEYTPAYFFQGVIFERTGKEKSAIEMHKKALEISPDYVPSLNNLAYLYAEGYGPVEKAVDMARRAREIAPRSGNVADTLGWALFKTGRYDDAVKNFREAADYLPAEPAVRYHLGLAYLKKGMHSKAAEELEKAISLGSRSNFPEIDEAKKLLEGIKKK